MVYTFWEGEMPEYVKLCMETWHFDYTLVTRDSLHNYTDVSISKLEKYTLPQIADYVRVHILRDNGGYWLDTDTIMLNNKLPEYDILGYPETRGNSIGFLHTEKQSEMYKKWAKYQDDMIDSDAPNWWGLLGNGFTDYYLQEHTEVPMGSIIPYFPEIYMIPSDTENIPRRSKYHKLYFELKYRLKDLNETDMLMLHNSWTPKWYKDMSRDEILSYDCTMSNILKEVNNL